MLASGKPVESEATGQNGAADPDLCLQLLSGHPGKKKTNQSVTGCFFKKNTVKYELSFTKAPTQEDFPHLCGLARTWDTSVERAPPYSNTLGGGGDIFGPKAV